ncbi:hypothetical protein ACO0QE_003109 [Hanseniaspora vineae]
MAGKSAKKIYNNNHKFQSNLKIVYFVILGCTLLLRYNLIMFYFLNFLPSYILLKLLDIESLTNSGIDLLRTETYKNTQYEFMIDYIYLSCLGNLGYLIFGNSIMVIYIGYKLFALKQQFFPSKRNSMGQNNNNNADGSATNKDGLSKRQQKLQKKQQKYQYR